MQLSFGHNSFLVNHGCLVIHLWLRCLCHTLCTVIYFLVSRILHVLCIPICFALHGKIRHGPVTSLVDGSDVGTCPCDRCCPTLGSDAGDATYSMQNRVSTFGKAPNRGDFHATSCFLLYKISSAPDKGLWVWSPLQATNLFGPFGKCMNKNKQSNPALLWIAYQHELWVFFLCVVHKTPFSSCSFEILCLQNNCVKRSSGIISLSPLHLRPFLFQVLQNPQSMSFTLNTCRSFNRVTMVVIHFVWLPVFWLVAKQGIHKILHYRTDIVLSSWPKIIDKNSFLSHMQHKYCTAVQQGGLGCLLIRLKTSACRMLHPASLWPYFAFMNPCKEYSQQIMISSARLMANVLNISERKVPHTFPIVVYRPPATCPDDYTWFLNPPPPRVLPGGDHVVCWPSGCAFCQNAVCTRYNLLNLFLTNDAYVFAILAMNSPQVGPLRPQYHRPKHISYAFDASLGFPGEGPDQWTCITANVESLATHPHYLNWQDDVQILQEIRIAKSNYDDVKFKLTPTKRTLYCSRFLELKQQKNAVYRIPHGGTGIIAPQALLQPFCASHDITGKWDDLACTTRVSGAWIQVRPNLKILMFSFYGHTSHTEKEEEIHELNNQILSVLFEITTQFGDVPIIIGGDFQKEPETFEAFQHAKIHKKWIDPIGKADEHGNITRPITFSRSGNFVNPADSVSSIDALLLNESAAAALESIDVLVGEARQHAPIRASFCWPKIYQTGFILTRPAPFNFDNLTLIDGKPDFQMLENTATNLWNQKYADLSASQDDNTSWQAINQYGIEILQSCGAVFGKGPKTRGAKPSFRQKTICPGQTKDGCAIVTASATLSKTHSMIAELSHRLQRKSEKQADMDITYQLQKKVSKKLENNPMFPGWNSERHLNYETLGVVQKILQKEICTLRQKEKYNRVQKWRAQMKEGTTTKNVDKKVFQWVKQKQAKHSANLIVGQDDNVIYNPLDAISEINSQWDSVYSINALHDEPMNILACVWPHIQKYRNPIDLPPLSGEDLKNQVLLRRPTAAPGMDGWRTIECQLLPKNFYEAVALFFNQVENGTRDLPHALVAAKQVILDKPAAKDTPLQKRVLTILPVMLLAYTGLRYKQLQGWQQNTLREIYGGIKNRKMTDAHTLIRLEIDHAKATDCHILGVKLDKSKCFDRLIPSVTAALFLAFGLPTGISFFFTKMYRGLHRYMTYKEWTSHISTTSCNGLAQGCSLSLLAINLHMAVWHAFVEHLAVHTATFIDDCYLWAAITNAACIEKAIELTNLWDELCGQKLNMSKCQIRSTNTKGRKILKDTFPNMQLVHLVEILGARIQTAEMKSFHWPSDRTSKICQDVKNIAALPCSRQLRAHLISTKAIPQLSFSPHISAIPKIALKQIQDEIAKTLWKGRPKWRSKLLLFGLLAQPHRSEPFLARSYNTILDCFSFLKNTTPEMRSKWIKQADSNCVSKK